MNAFEVKFRHVLSVYSRIETMITDTKSRIEGFYRDTGHAWQA